MLIRITIAATFVGVGLLWLAFAGWIIWRLGPGGYSADDAQGDRERLCAALIDHFPDKPFVCPPIREAHK